jgi:hypothetical protein
MGTWVGKLEAMRAEDAARPRREQRTAQRLHDGLVQEGFTGSYPTVQRFVKAWREARHHGNVFIPQSFAPGGVPVRLELRDGRARRSADTGEGGAFALVLLASVPGGGVLARSARDGVRRALARV